jgi:O-antigen/teichoic acid export membrane protein
MDAPNPIDKDARTPRLTALLRRPQFAAALAFGGRISQQVTGTVILLVAAGFLSPAEYGVYTLATAFALLLQTFTYAGVYHFIIREPGDERVLLDSGFLLMMAIGLVGGLALIAVAPVVESVFAAPTLGPVLIYLAIDQIIGVPLAWISAVILRRQQMTVFYVGMLVHNALSLAVGFACLVLWPSVFALVVYKVASTLIGTTIYFASTRTFPGRRISLPLMRSALSYSSGLYGSRVMNFLYRYGADILIGYFFSTSEAGLFRLASRVASGLTDIVLQPLLNFAIVRFGAARRFGHDMKPLFSDFLSTTTTMLGLAIVAIVIFIGPAVTIFLGPEYMPVIWVTYALCVGRLASLGQIYVEPVASAKGNTVLVFYFTTLGAALSLGSMFAGLPWGFNGVIVAQAIAMIVAGTIGLLIVARLLTLNVGEIVKPLASGALYTAVFAAGTIGLVYALGFLGWGELWELIAGAALTAIFGLALLALAVRQKVVSARVFTERN